MALPRLARCGFPSSTQRDSGGLLCATARDGQTNESVASAIAAMRRFDMRVTTLRLAALYLNTATLLTVARNRRRCHCRQEGGPYFNAPASRLPTFAPPDFVTNEGS